MISRAVPGRGSALLYAVFGHGKAAAAHAEPRPGAWKIGRDVKKLLDFCFDLPAVVVH